MPRVTQKMRLPRDNGVHAQVEPEAKAFIQAYCRPRGTIEKVFLSRLVYWFQQLDELEQGIVLKQITGPRVGEVASVVLLRDPELLAGLMASVAARQAEAQAI